MRFGQTKYILAFVLWIGGAVSASAQGSEASPPVASDQRSIRVCLGNYRIIRLLTGNAPSGQELKSYHWPGAYSAVAASSQNWAYREDTVAALLKATFSDPNDGDRAINATLQGAADAAKLVGIEVSILPNASSPKVTQVMRNVASCDQRFAFQPQFRTANP